MKGGITYVPVADNWFEEMLRESSKKQYMKLPKHIKDILRLEYD